MTEWTMTVVCEPKMSDLLRCFLGENIFPLCSKACRPDLAPQSAAARGSGSKVLRTRSSL